MAEKSIRLGKAAGELNVGIATLTEFLASKGVKIDNNPNTKLEGSHYELLQSEFAADQTIKEQSKMTHVKREKRETISIRDTRQNEAPKVEDEDDLDQAALDKFKNSNPFVAKTETPNENDLIVEKTNEINDKGCCK
jgi:translation initiation factor IF-2